jgi:L-ascorbate metabolism protein UlaG (beta-lactamase superfamily)
MKRLQLFTAAIAGLAFFVSAARALPFSDPRSDRITAIDSAGAGDPRDAACRARTLVSAGGAFPRNRNTLAVRWAGFANYELVYNGKIILLDAYYDRGSYYPPLGVKAADISRADVMLIGHGHSDHMSDAASIGAKTGALVVGAPVTVEKLMTQSIPGRQLKTVTGKGGEVLRFDGFTVEPILGRHSEPEGRVGEVLGPAINSLLPAMTSAQKAEEVDIRSRGTTGPRVITEGTIAFLITLDNGFRILFRDSAGAVTEYEKAAMARVGPVDIAIIAFRAAYLPSFTIPQAMDYLRTYRPDVVLPAHHDAGLVQGHDGLWRSTEPVFQALKEESPELFTLSLGYREPVCFNTDFNVSRGR